MEKKINWKKLLLSILIPELLGFVSGYVSGNIGGSYAALTLPPLSPPGAVFPVAWFLLYLLMGVALYIVLQSDASPEQQAAARRIFGLQLAVNLLWSPLYFGLNLRLLAFFWLLLLLVLVIQNIRVFYKINPCAGYLLIPYLLWLMFAAYLNFATWLLNR